MYFVDYIRYKHQYPIPSPLFVIFKHLHRMFEVCLATILFIFFSVTEIIFFLSVYTIVVFHIFCD